MHPVTNWSRTFRIRRHGLPRWTRLFVAVAAALTLAACSGGAGAGDSGAASDDGLAAAQEGQGASGADSDGTERGLVAHYPLEDGFDSSVSDAPALEPVGKVALVDDDDPSGSTAATFDPGSGLQLDADGLIEPDVYTVAMRLQLEDFEGWSKLVDHHDRSVDEGFYAYARAFQFWGYPLVEGRAPVDEYATVVLRRDDAGTISWFLDGVHTADVDDVDDHGVFDPLTIGFFLDDTGDPDDGIEESSGRVAWISIYDRALPDTTVADLQGSDG